MLIYTVFLLFYLHIVYYSSSFFSSQTPSPPLSCSTLSPLWLCSTWAANATLSFHLLFLHQSFKLTLLLQILKGCQTPFQLSPSTVWFINLWFLSFLWFFQQLYTNHTHIQCFPKSMIEETCLYCHCTQQSFLSWQHTPFLISQNKLRMFHKRFWILKVGGWQERGFCKGFELVQGW